MTHEKRPPGHAVATAKLTVPGARQVTIARHSLQDRLQERTRDARLTLIAAPAGFGKTTLLSSWLRREDMATAAWLSLDEGDRDGARFVRGCVAALQAVAPGIGRHAVFDHGPRSTGGAMASLRSELDQLPTARPFVFVLDDYHAAETDDINAAIAELVDCMPAAMRLVILSRRIPALPLRRWRSSEWLAEFDERDLRFSRDEAAAFLHEKMGLRLSDEAVGALEARTEGWVVGLLLAGLTLQHRRDASPCGADAVVSFGGRNRLVADYLTGEVLASQPEHVRAFLRRTSVLRRFTREACTALSGDPRAGEILEDLERSNLFLVALDDDGRWFRYHELFADFLANTLSAEEAVALHAQASAWHEDQQLLDEALRHARAAGDPVRTVHLLQRHAEELLCRGEFASLREALVGLPDEAMRAHADVAHLTAWLLSLQGRCEEATRYRAFAYDGQRAACVESGWIAIVQAYFALLQNDAQATATWAAEALQRLADDSPYFRVLAMSYLGQAQAALAQRGAALTTLRQAHRLGIATGNLLGSASTLTHIAALLQQQGRLREGVELSREAIACYRDGVGQPLWIAGAAQVALGMLLYELDELGEAQEAFDIADRFAARGVLWTRLVGLCWHAKLKYAMGSKDEAWSMLARARELTESGGGSRRRRTVDRVAAELHLKEGRHELAARILDTGPGSDHAVPSVCETLLEGHIWLGRHDPETALSLVQPVESAAAREGFEGTRVRALLLMALCQRALGRAQRAAGLVRDALSIAEPIGVRRAFRDAGPWVAAQANFRPVTGAIATIDVLPAVLPPPGRLTGRDIELLNLLSQGLQNKEIAESMSITLGTTKQYVNRLFSKLGVRNRVEAVMALQELNATTAR